jgi:hypothetical protein
VNTTEPTVLLGRSVSTFRRNILPEWICSVCRFLTRFNLAGLERHLVPFLELDSSLRRAQPLLLTKLSLLPQYLLSPLRYSTLLQLPSTGPDPVTFRLQLPSAVLQLHSATCQQIGLLAEYPMALLLYLPSAVLQLHSATYQQVSLLAEYPLVLFLYLPSAVLQLHSATCQQIGLLAEYPLVLLLYSPQPPYSDRFRYAVRKVPGYSFISVHNFLKTSCKFFFQRFGAYFYLCFLGPISASIGKSRPC